MFRLTTPAPAAARALAVWLAAAAPAAAHMPPDGIAAAWDGLAHPLSDGLAALPTLALVLGAATAGRRGAVACGFMVVAGGTLGAGVCVAMRRIGLVPDAALPVAALALGVAMALLGPGRLGGLAGRLTAAFVVGVLTVLVIMPPGPTLAAALLFTAADTGSRAALVAGLGIVLGEFVRRPRLAGPSVTATRILAAWIAAAALMSAALVLRG